MSSLFIVLKADLINSLGLNKIFKEKSRNEKYKSLALALAILVGMGSLFFTAFIYFYLMADGLESIGYLQLILIYTILVSTMVSLFTSIFKAQGNLFGSKDYDMLMSLPIKPWVILTSKLSMLLLSNYLFTPFVLIPGTVVYFLKCDSSPLIFLYLLVVYFFVPLIPIVLASIIAFILTYFSSKIRFKNLFITIGSLGLLALIMIFSMDINNIIEKIVTNSASIEEAIHKIYPPAFYFVNGLVKLDFISILKFIGISSLIFVIFICVLGRSFKTINAKLGENYKKSNYTMTSLKTSSPIKALINKEIKRYFASSVYVLNTSVGSFLLLLSSLGIAIFGSDTIITLLEIPATQEIMPQMLVVMFSLFAVLTCTTCSSISIEGKNLWILKSSPIKVEDIFISKIVVNLIILIPSIIISALLLCFPLKLTFMDILWIIVIPVLLSFFMSFIGLLINLYFPKLDWTSEIKVIKQSLPPLLSMLVGALSVAVPCFIFIYFKVSNFLLYVIIISIVITMINLLLWKFLKTKGKALFNAL